MVATLHRSCYGPKGHPYMQAPPFMPTCCSLHARAPHTHRVRDFGVPVPPWLRYWMIPPAYVHPAPIPRVRSWTQRQYDVLIYAKFADLDRRACVQGMQDALERHNVSFLRLEYGSYDKATLLEGANNARIAVLASWYDCGVSDILGGLVFSAPKILQPTTMIFRSAIVAFTPRSPWFHAACPCGWYHDAKAFIRRSL